MPYTSEVEGKMQPWPLKPLFDHDYFTVDNIGITQLNCLLRRLVKHRPAATVAVLLAALKDHTGACPV